MISTYVKRSIGEERYEAKVSRTVLKRGLGSDTHSYFNIPTQFQRMERNGDHYLFVLVPFPLLSIEAKKKNELSLPY